VGDTMIAEAALATLAKRGANRMIHEIVSPVSGAELIGFFCECADPNCHKVRWLTAEAFELACADPNWHVLAPRHEAPLAESAEQS
jgi:hypothetical protein